ncbi:MAG: prepilin peptidase [Mariprofundaceae bacterium]
MDLQLLVILSCAVLGLIVGSFANVCVYRIPRGESVAFPGSHCPNCEQMIAWYDNIPLLSWLLLRGQCRQCKLAISFRYPFLEALMGLSWAALAWHYGLSDLLFESLLLITLLWILSLIDFETGLLPNVLTFPGIAAGLLFSWSQGSLLDATIGAGLGYGIFWLLARVFLLLTGKQGMGYGDFKLLAMLGAFMGWQALPFIIFSASFVGAVVGMIYLKVASKHRHTEIPFGPYLALAGMVWFVWGESLLQAYMRILMGGVG